MAKRLIVAVWQVEEDRVPVVKAWLGVGQPRNDLAPETFIVSKRLDHLSNGESLKMLRALQVKLPRLSCAESGRYDYLKAQEPVLLKWEQEEREWELAVRQREMQERAEVKQWEASNG